MKLHIAGSTNHRIADLEERKGKKIVNTLDKELLYMSSSELNYYFSHGWSIYWVEIRIHNVKCPETHLYRSKDRLPYEKIKAALEARTSEIEVIQIVERRQWKVT